VGDAGAKKPDVPAAAPQQLKDFVECTGTTLGFKVGDKLDWFPDPVPTITIGEISTTAAGGVQIKGSAAEGFVSVSVTISVSNGKLDAQLEGLTNFVGGDKAADWVKQLNDWLASNGKKLDAPKFDKAKKTATIAKSAAAAKADPKATPQPGVKAAPVVPPEEPEPVPAPPAFPVGTAPLADGDAIYTGDPEQADLVVTIDADTGETQIDEYGAGKRRVGCGAAALVVMLVALAGGLVVYGVTRGGSHSTSGPASHPTGTESPTPSSGGTQATGVANFGFLKSAELEKVPQGHLAYNSNPALPPIPATVPSSDIKGILYGNVVLNATQASQFGCTPHNGYLVVCGANTAPLTPATYQLFGVDLGGNVLPVGTNWYGFGFAFQDTSQIARSYQPSAHYARDYFGLSTSDVRLDESPQSGWMLNYFVANGPMLTREPSPFRAIVAGPTVLLLAPPNTVGAKEVERFYVIAHHGDQCQQPPYDDCSGTVFPWQPAAYTQLG